MRPTLPLDYGADVPEPMLELLEHHGRAVGLPLEVLELLGQDLDAVEGFILAVEDGRVWEYVARVDMARLQAKLKPTGSIKLPEIPLPEEGLGVGF